MGRRFTLCKIFFRPDLNAHDPNISRRFSERWRKQSNLDLPIRPQILLSDIIGSHLLNYQAQDFLWHGEVLTSQIWLVFPLLGVRETLLSFHFLIWFNTHLANVWFICNPFVFKLPTLDLLSICTFAMSRNTDLQKCSLFLIKSLRTPSLFGIWLLAFKPRNLIVWRSSILCY